MNNATKNINVQISVRVLAFNYFRYMLRSGIAVSYGNSIFNFFEEPLYYFPQWLHHFTSPPARHNGSNLSTYLPTPVLVFFSIFVFFLKSLSNGCEVETHGLVSITLIIRGVEHLFMCSLAIVIISLEKYLLTSFAHF